MALDGVGDASVYGTLRRLYASGALTSSGVGALCTTTMSLVATLASL